MNERPTNGLRSNRDPKDHERIPPLPPPRRRARRGRAPRHRRRDEPGRRPRHRRRRGQRALQVPTRDRLVRHVHRRRAGVAADGRRHAHLGLHPRAQPHRPARPAALRPRHRDGRQVAPRAQPRPVFGPRHGRLRAGVRRRHADRPRPRPVHGHVPDGPRRDRQGADRLARGRRGRRAERLRRRRLREHVPQGREPRRRPPRVPGEHVRRQGHLAPARDGRRERGERRGDRRRARGRDGRLVRSPLRERRLAEGRRRARVLRGRAERDLGAVGGLRARPQDALPVHRAAELHRRSGLARRTRRRLRLARVVVPSRRPFELQVLPRQPVGRMAGDGRVEPSPRIHRDGLRVGPDDARALHRDARHARVPGVLPHGPLAVGREIHALRLLGELRDAAQLHRLRPRGQRPRVLGLAPERLPAPAGLQLPQLHRRLRHADLALGRHAAGHDRVGMAHGPRRHALRLVRPGELHERRPRRRRAR